MKHLHVCSASRPKAVKACFTLPGDKSIAHRALMLSALAQGVTHITNIPDNQDCRATIGVLRSLGVRIEVTPRMKASGCLRVRVHGRGGTGLRQPKKPVSVGESGTTLRLSLGLAAGQELKVRFVSGEGLGKRPMRRVTAPLRLMGAKLHGRRLKMGSQEYPPVTLEGGRLKGIRYTLPVASAQVKSALLLAGLYARGRTTVVEPAATRDHTERMLAAFGVRVAARGRSVSVTGGSELVSPQRIYVPGDISSAAFFLVLGAILPRARFTLRAVSLNPSRMGVVKALKRMGARLVVKITDDGRRNGEPYGEITVSAAGRLRGIRIKKHEIPSLIDEIPVLMVAACYAEGETVFEHVDELRVKETDRIEAMVRNLRALGGAVALKRNRGSECLSVTGVGSLSGGRVNSYGDHRTAMSMVVAALAARGPTKIAGVGCIRKSFPGFIDIIRRIFLFDKGFNL